MVYYDMNMLGVKCGMLGDARGCDGQGTVFNDMVGSMMVGV